VRGCACHVLRTRCMTNADRGTRIRWRFASRYNTESLTSIIVRAQVSSSDRRHFSPQHAAVHIASSCTPPARCTSRFFIGRLLCLLQGLSRCRHDKKIPAQTLFLRPRGCPRGSSRHQGRSDFSWVLPPRAGDPAGNMFPPAHHCPRSPVLGPSSTLCECTRHSGFCTSGMKLRFAC
jgi:hypothetical protein